ncbi:hypothetical protein PROFUN_05871 [Planoprotostelium fungivorum]|uniref:Uncharacterized protein n=1 Tax=Planoprotostelium fungivorum TaxID=1890364 RepID=A0A2P6NKS9_9EUKA|nr:hypothetical protein PROFUN_05871 [Planoprotostelium fungivorum]
MLSLVFLGTSSAKPTATRNTSSLALNLEKEWWLFDCGEGTQHQLQKSKGLALSKMSKIFITHMHADHMFGLIPLMASTFNGMGGQTEEGADTRVEEAQSTEPFEIYGPFGLREYIRKSLLLTYTQLGRMYTVHELHPGPIPSDRNEGQMHPCEVMGRDISIENGAWKAIHKDALYQVDASPILHSVFSLGFVITEAPTVGTIDKKSYEPALNRNKAQLAAQGVKNPMSLLGKLQKNEKITLPDGTVLEPPGLREGRKVVILGDTHDPSAIAPLSHGATVLVHEATNAYLPESDSAAQSMTREEHQEWTMSRGHSTPEMAGAFAASIGANALVMNHFSARYRADDPVMDDIKALAEQKIPGKVVICSKDLMTIEITKNNVVRVKEETK